MIILRSFFNALSVYGSYLEMPQSFCKPTTCNVMECFSRSPKLFESKDMCPDCTCKFSCRYTRGTPKLAYLTPFYNNSELYINKEYRSAECYFYNYITFYKGNQGQIIEILAPDLFLDVACLDLSSETYSLHERWCSQYGHDEQEFSRPHVRASRNPRKRTPYSDGGVASADD